MSSATHVQGPAAVNFRSALWAWARLVGGAGVLVVLVWRLGTGPFIGGVRTVDAMSLVAAIGITGLTTACCAWRWRLVARGLGMEVSFTSAVAACYRSQFLNTVLPGGVLGDVHRGVSHGLNVEDVGRGMRAVVWERASGQAVQVALALVVLVTLPSPVRGSMPWVVGALAAGSLAAVLVTRALPADGHSRLSRLVRAARADVRVGVLSPAAWPGVASSSVVVVAGHTTVFLVAARTAGTTTSLTRLLPLALLVLLAMSLPTTLGGWGPREGVAAWAFATAGLGAAQGVATAVVYGVLVVASTLPGAAVMVLAWRRQPAQKCCQASPLELRVPVGAVRARGTHG